MSAVATNFVKLLIAARAASIAATEKRNLTLFRRPTNTLAARRWTPEPGWRAQQSRARHSEIARRQHRNRRAAR